MEKQPEFPSQPNAPKASQQDTVTLSGKTVKMKNRHARKYSEFTSTGFDFRRIDIIMQECDLLSQLNSAYKMNSIRPFFSALNNLYTNLRPLLSSSDIQYWDDFVEILRAKIYNENNVVTPNIHTTLDKFYKALVQLRQELNMGISVIKRGSVRHSLRRGLGLQGHDEEAEDD